MQETLTFNQFLHARPAPKGIDAVSQLHHFAIVTYAIDPVRFASLIPPRFKLNTVLINGEEKALLSVVPFMDVDFTTAVYPFPKFRMGQTNYRIYIIDTKTGERAVWFLGTTLDSWAVAVPRYGWKLPWYAGKMTFECEFDNNKGVYSQYHMKTESKWAAADLVLTQDELAEIELPGFPDTETGLVTLTHPLAGYYYRRDGKLGGYRVWHKRLNVMAANLHSARFELLSRMGLVSEREQQMAYSVLIQPLNEFTIYLPPKAVG